MNHPETVKLLALMAAMDRRTIGDAEVMAWQGVLDDVDFANAAEAVRRHYRDSDDYLMPVHVRRGAAEVAAERNRPAPSPWAPGQYGVSKEDAHPEITDTVRALEELPASVLDLVTRVRAMLPEGSREALMPRTVEWERQHAAYRRQQEAEPNPHYRPTASRESCAWPHECPTVEACRMGCIVPAVGKSGTVDH